MNHISSLDIPGLHTLGTAVVDYAGWRIVGQTIVPGVLKRDQKESSSVISGSVDSGKTIFSDGKLGELLEKTTEALHLRPHKVKDHAGNVHTLNSSFECKGILGWDSRHYVLDLFRITPPDANFVEAPPAEFPARHKLQVMRPELISNYYEAKLVEFLKQKVQEKKSLQEAAKAAAAAAAAPSEPATEGSTDLVEKKEGEAVAEESEPIDLSLPEFQFRLDFNPDVFTSVALAGTEEENEADKEAVRKLAKYITEVALPKFAFELQHGTLAPIDGSNLRDAMHLR